MPWQSTSMDASARRAVERQYQLMRELLEQAASRQDIANLRREMAVALESVAEMLEAVLKQLAERPPK